MSKEVVYVHISNTAFLQTLESPEIRVFCMFELIACGKQWFYKGKSNYLLLILNFSNGLEEVFALSFLEIVCFRDQILKIV